MSKQTDAIVPLVPQTESNSSSPENKRSEREKREERPLPYVVRLIGAFSIPTLILSFVFGVSAIFMQLKQANQQHDRANELARTTIDLEEAHNSNVFVDQAAAFNSHLIEHQDLARLWYGYSEEQVAGTLGNR